MTEDEILMTVVAHLRWARVTFCHVPNERKGSAAQQSRWNRLGREPGVPDILIFDPTGRFVGAALELKTDKAARSGRTITRQREWLSKLQTRGYATAMTFGLDEALTQLRTWGYIK